MYFGTIILSHCFFNYFVAFESSSKLWSAEWQQNPRIKLLWGQTTFTHSISISGSMVFFLSFTVLLDCVHSSLYAMPEGTGTQNFNYCLISNIQHSTQLNRDPLSLFRSWILNPEYYSGNIWHIQHCWTLLGRVLKVKGRAVCHSPFPHYF